AFRIDEPDPVFVGKRMRFRRFDAECLQARNDPVVVPLKRAEAHVLQAFRPGLLMNRSPAVLVAERVEIDPLSRSPRIEAEVRIERCRSTDVGDGEDKAMQRVHCGHAVATGGRAWGRAHGFSSARASRYAGRCTLASTTVSAVMLTIRRTVAEGVRMCTGFATPSRIGPSVTPPPAATLSR